jgi:predicted RNA-binding protein with RPS1 domain
MPIDDGQNVSDFISEGQEIQVRILHVDSMNQRMGLSLNLDGTDA